MSRNLSESSGIINKCQLFLGIVSLLAGSWEYLANRPWNTTYFLSKFSFLEKYFHKLPGIYGSLGGNVPEFFHVLAFSLLSASVASQNRRNRIIICLFWFGVDFSFELGQKYPALIHEYFTQCFSDTYIIGLLDAYFRQGLYDKFDLLAIMLGSVTFLLLAELTSKKQSSNCCYRKEG